MDSELGSISRLICDLRDGDLAAAQPLWERYFKALVSIARRRLQDSPRQFADEEDAAISAFASFCRAIDKGRFPSLRDRDDLWKLLVAMTIRKAIDQQRYDGRLIRDAARTQGLGDSRWFVELLQTDPTPEIAAIAHDECNRLLAMLGDELCQKIAVAKLEGYTNREIAGQLDWSLATIERCLRRIRKTWEQEIS